MSKTIAAIFEDQHSAENAARAIKSQGIPTEDISILARFRDTDTTTPTTTTMGTADTMGTTDTMGGTTATDTTTHDTTSHSKPKNDNISDGVVTGGILGGLAGLLIGTGSLAIPGLGVLAAAGPIAGLLSGTLTGGLVGGLIDLGIPEGKGKEYESDLQSGRVLFSMRTDKEHVDPIIAILNENGAKNVDVY